VSPSMLTIPHPEEHIAERLYPTGHRCRRGRPLRWRAAPHHDSLGGGGPQREAGAGGGPASGGEHPEDHCHGLHRRAGQGAGSRQHRLPHHGAHLKPLTELIGRALGNGRQLLLWPSWLQGEQQCSCSGGYVYQRGDGGGG